MMKIMFIALGGGIGTAARYMMSGIDYRFSDGVFPFSTLAINLCGSLMIGFLWGMFERSLLSPEIRMFLFVGILGGFTTFSTFALENFNLIRDGEYRVLAWNIVLSNVLGVALVFAGFILARWLMGILK